MDYVKSHHFDHKWFGNIWTANHERFISNLTFFERFVYDQVFYPWFKHLLTIFLHFSREKCTKKAIVILVFYYHEIIFHEFSHSLKVWYLLQVNLFKKFTLVNIILKKKMFDDFFTIAKKLYFLIAGQIWWPITTHWTKFSHHQHGFSHFSLL